MYSSLRLISAMLATLIWSLQPAFAGFVVITASTTFNPAGSCPSGATCSPNFPTDWPTNNTARVECLGSGGTGSARASTSVAGTGGGGGEYAAEPALVISTSHSVTIGAGNGTTNTSFPGDSVTVTAHYGATGTTSTPGAGGSGSTNTWHNNGGGGGAAASGVPGGGGGAGGYWGAGAAGTNAGAGGQPDVGYPGIGANPVARGTAGYAGWEWDGTPYGSGWGGGGATTTGAGLAGGGFGGGGGGHGTGTSGTNGAGAGGGCVIIYQSKYAFNGCVNAPLSNSYSPTSAGSPTAMSCLLNSPTAANDVLSISVYYYTNGTTSLYNNIIDDKSDTATLVDSLTSEGTVFGIWHTAYIKATSGARVVTANFTSTIVSPVIMVDDIGKYPTLDQHNIADLTSSGCTSSPCSGTAVTTTANGEMIVGQTYTGGPITAGSGFTLNQLANTSSSSSQFATEYKTQTTNGSTTVSFAEGTPGGGVISTMTFAPSIACPVTFLLLGVGC